MNRPRFRTSYEAHVGTVLRILRRLGVSPGDIEDVCHEVFLVFMRRLPEIADAGSDGAFLCAVAYRCASDYRKLRRHDAQELSPDGATSASPENLYALRGDLERALDQLSEARRAVLVLHGLEGMSAREIADVMQIPENTVYSRLRLAREDFERAIGNEVQS